MCTKCKERNNCFAVITVVYDNSNVNIHQHAEPQAVARDLAEVGHTIGQTRSQLQPSALSLGDLTLRGKVLSA